MNRLINHWILFAGLAGMALSAHAGYEQGQAAYQKGDYATAFKEFSADASKGDVKAENYLGIMYENGRGVTADYATSNDVVPQGGQTEFRASAK